jgi:hypothetical protein
MKLTRVFVALALVLVPAIAGGPTPSAQAPSQVTVTLVRWPFT